MHRLTRAAVGTAASLAVLGATAVPALAGGAQHAPAPATGPMDLGSAQAVGATVPSSCLFTGTDDVTVAFTDGKAVFHGETNSNGDWGGETAQGPALFLVNGVPTYQGHLTVWEGGGNNSTMQSENGFTLNFTGTGINAPSSTVAFHVNTHGTTNAAGTPTANVFDVQIACT